MPYVSGSGTSLPTLAVGVVRLTSGNLTTASTNFVDATGLTVTMTTGARRCFVTFSGLGENATGNNGGPYVDLNIDGTRVGGTDGLAGADNSGNGFNSNLGFSFLTDVLTAASHTFKIQWHTNGASTSTMLASATAPAVLSVQETLFTT